MNLITAFLDRRREQRTRKLYEEAHELLDGGSYEEALKFARKLRKVRYSGAFEIEALAYSALEQYDDAVRVLREGLALAPAAWPNWMLLASTLSDLKQYDEALLAYDRAQACSGSDRNVIDYNRGIVAWRQKKPQEALRLFDGVLSYPDPEFGLKVVAARVGVLHDLGRDAEAEDLGVRTLNAWVDTESEYGSEQIGATASVVTAIRRKRGDNPLKLRTEAIEWWRRTNHDELLWEIRELQNRRSPDAQYFRMAIEAVLTEETVELFGGEANAFHRKIEVIADTPEEGLEYYKELEFLDATFSVGETENLGRHPESPKGVYWLAGRILYKEE